MAFVSIPLTPFDMHLSPKALSPALSTDTTRSNIFFFEPLISFQASSFATFTFLLLTIDKQVEGVVFRVPRAGFEKSSLFTDLYGVIPSYADGDDDSKASPTILINGANPAEFTAFLKLLIRPYAN